MTNLDILINLPNILEACLHLVYDLIITLVFTYKETDKSIMMSYLTQSKQSYSEFVLLIRKHVHPPEQTNTLL